MTKKEMYEKIMSSIAKEVKSAINEAYVNNSPSANFTPEQKFYFECIERKKNGETWSKLASDFNIMFGKNISADAMRGRVNKIKEICDNTIDMYPDETELTSYYPEDIIEDSTRAEVIALKQKIEQLLSGKYTPEKNSNNDSVDHSDKALKTGDSRINVNDIVNVGHTDTGDVVDLGLPSGTKWCRYNLGATCGDTPKSWYGNYYAWGEVATKKYYTWAHYKYDDTNTPKYYSKVDNKNVLDLEDDVVHLRMGGKWHMPTIEQIIELCENTDSMWVRNYQHVSGLYGCLFTSKVNGNTLFIPAAGYFSDSSIHNAGINSYLWSNSLDTDSQGFARNLYISSDKVVPENNNFRFHGLSVRGVL